MTVLMLGATGATGRHALRHLLERGVAVTAIVRSKQRLMDLVGESGNLSIIEGGISELDNNELAKYTEGADAVISCLGHNLNLRGIYGKPRMLVTDTVRRICSAVQSHAPQQPVKYILMNTTGNQNRDLVEHRSIVERIVISLLSLLLPPQRDNENAADFLRTQIGQENKWIEWAAVRPDTLINEDNVSGYDVHPAPVRSAIFNPGKTSRINVGHFMAELLIDESLWKKWKGQMPVIYNR